MQAHRFSIGRWRAVAAVLAVSIVGGAWAPARGQETATNGAEVLALQSAEFGQEIIFTVQIKRPDNMGAQTIEMSIAEAWRRSGFPRMAQLRSQPIWDVPCYSEYELENYWQPISRRDRLTFIGRCPAVQTLELTFRYPISDDEWAEVPIRLVFADATPLADDPPPVERWVLAQSKWFELLSRQTGDVGGFYTFAAQQSRRQHGMELLERTDERFQRRWGAQRDPEERYYAITTGALAVQESLQLDRMTETDRDRAAPTIPVSDITALGMLSHPFDKMRGDKQPIHSPLARLVPQTQYYVHFSSVAKLLDVLDFAERWGPSLLRLASPVGTDYGTRPRTHAQLCLPDDVLARLLGPLVVDEIALTGSDPYLRDGSDITVLFAAADKAAFASAVDVPFRRAQADHPDARHDEVVYEGVAIERLVSPRRGVSCHRCWLDNVCVYSNSLAAIQRVVDTHAGRRDNLASAPDFRYMRASVFPYDSEQEDGFIYLSDPFIRYVVGPELRIKQKRRREAVTSLKLLTNAVMYYGYLHGPGSPTFEDLVKDKSLDPDDLYDPEGGTITWDSQAAIARSSTYGDLSFLTPLIETDTELATERERDEYDRFRDRYQRYWREYFDPIGVRIKAGRTIQLDTCILPLIDSSAYERFEDTAGGDPIAVRVDQFTPDTLLRYVMKFNSGVMRTQALTLIGTMTNATTDWVGDWVTFWIEDTDAFTDVVRHAYAADDTDADERQRQGQQAVIDIFNASFVGGIHVRNKLSLAAFLVALRTVVQTTAPNLVVFNNLQPYKGVTIVQIAPDPSGDIARELGLKGERSPDTTDSQPAVSERGPALYYATIGDGLYVSTQAPALRGLIDQLEQTAETQSASAETLVTNIMIYAAPGRAALVRPAVSYLLEQRARQVSLANLSQVWLLGRCGLLSDEHRLEPIARSYLGYRLVCPNGGTYRFDADTGEAHSSIYGPLSAPRRLEEMPEGSPLGDLLDSLQTVKAHLRFTEDGLETGVAIERR